MNDFERDKDVLISIAKKNYKRCNKVLNIGDLPRAIEHFQDMILQAGQQIGTMYATYDLEDDSLDDLYFSISPYIDQIRNKIVRLLTLPPHSQNPFCTEDYDLY